MLTKVQEVSEIVDESENGGGCLIATATYGSEMANEVQQLRELSRQHIIADQIWN